MSIIKDNVEGEFSLIKQGSSRQVVEQAAPKLLPKMGDSSRVVNGGSNRFSGRYVEAMMQKRASGLTGAETSANILTSSPEIRNPLLNLINFYLPYDRKTLNQWIRYYLKFHPYVGNCTDLNAEFPISDFHFTNMPKDPHIEDIFEQQKEVCNLVDFCFEASTEFEALGEAFTFFQFNEDLGLWDDYTVMNPDMLDVKELNWGAGKKAVYTYEAPQELKDLFKDPDPAVQELMYEMDPVVRENIAAGKKIPLSSFNVFPLLRKTHAYETRGTSLILRCIKDLMYEDKLREAQYSIADQQITPVQLWKIGDAAAGYMPTSGDLEDFRNLLLAGRHDFLFTIVTHSAVNLDLIGYTGKLLPILPEMEWVAKRVMVALFTNEAMITGSGGGYSNAVVGLKTIQGRYQSKRDKLAKGIQQRLLKPVASHHQIFERKTADLAHRVRTSNGTKLVVPDIEWNFKLDLTDESQRIQYLMTLAQKTKVPMQTICDVLHLDYDKVKASLKSEEGTVFDDVYQEARSAKAKKGGGAAPGDTDAGGDFAGGDMPDIGGGGGETPPEGGAEGGEAATPPEGNTPTVENVNP